MNEQHGHETLHSLPPGDCEHGRKWRPVCCAVLPCGQSSSARARLFFVTLTASPSRRVADRPPASAQKRRDDDRAERRFPREAEDALLLEMARAAAPCRTSGARITMFGAAGEPHSGARATQRRRGQNHRPRRAPPSSTPRQQENGRQSRRRAAAPALPAAAAVRRAGDAVARRAAAAGEEPRQTDDARVEIGFDGKDVVVDVTRPARRARVAPRGARARATCDLAAAARRGGAPRASRPSTRSPRGAGQRARPRQDNHAGEARRSGRRRRLRPGAAKEFVKTGSWLWAATSSPTRS